MLQKDKFSHTVISVLGILILTYLFFKFALAGILPIILGWLISLLIYPLSGFFARKMGVSRQVISGILVILFFFLLIFLAVLGIRRLFFELGSFAEELQDHPEIIENALANINQGLAGSRLFSGFDKIISALGEYAYIADEIINNVLESTLSSLGELIGNFARGFVMGIPTALLFFITLILSAFYFSVDRNKIYAYIGSLVPESAKSKIMNFTEGGIRAAAGYIKSSLILMIITFFEMLVFLTLLRVEYSLIISIVIALVDVLPLLGVGAVLIPWSIYSFIVSDVRMGIWLLVLFVLATVIRNIVEPKILGKRIGVHPFLVIASAYLGFTLFGGVGLILFPVVAATLSNAKKRKIAYATFVT